MAFLTKTSSSLWLALGLTGFVLCWFGYASCTPLPLCWSDQDCPQSVCVKTKGICHDQLIQQTDDAGRSFVDRDTPDRDTNTPLDHSITRKDEGRSPDQNASRDTNNDQPDETLATKDDSRTKPERFDPDCKGSNKKKYWKYCKGNQGPPDKRSSPDCTHKNPKKCK